MVDMNAHGKVELVLFTATHSPHTSFKHESNNFKGNSKLNIKYSKLPYTIRTIYFYFVFFSKIL